MIDQPFDLEQVAPGSERGISALEWTEAVTHVFAISQRLVVGDYVSPFAMAVQ